MLTGRKVVLRAFERDDLKLLHKWENDEEIMRLASSFPDQTISMVGLEAKYEKALKGEDFFRRDYMIDERTSNKPVGSASITIYQRTKRATSADIGLVVGEKDRWRKGYGTEVVLLLLKEAFEQLNLHRVGWWTYAENAPSLGLARKMGFKEEGRLRDSVYFDNRYHDTIVLGLLKEEYEAAKNRLPTS